MNIVKREYGELLLIFIIMAVLLLSFIIIMLSFFIVRVRGALEESDEVYELICPALIKLSKGRWQVNLKEVFNEYAAVKLTFGWVFLELFEGFTIEGLASGDKKGVVTSLINKETILLRRRIRLKD